ncbi:hypothetical protein SASPL_110273 [Salvia splendens]|uniref:EF-hand domain-containing protein n=1 Tax=Salvia splendens TaxID=180675 RepID=A0A8X9A423_SALSN|nr:hypothetical protein SASPL_110273 [Salvia splendens]
MGSALSVFTQYDIEEVQEHCNHLFTQQEIVSLYKRFYQLDRNSKGFISSDEFLSVPEFAMNPLSQRLLKMKQREEVLSQLLQEAGYTKSRLLCWTTPSRYWIIKSLHQEYISPHPTTHETDMPNEASTSRCKKQSVQPTSTSSSSNRRGEAVIKRLEGRLKILEEEAEILKGALLESAEESRTLIGDIHLQLYTIQCHLLQRGAERGELRSHVTQRVKVSITKQ